VTENYGGYNDIRVARSGAALRITLARPERLNAVTYDMLAELRDAIESARRDTEVRCVVLEGEGRGFCSGDNLKGLGQALGDLDKFTRYLEAGYPSVVRAMRTLPKPIIAKLHGYVLGAGLELAMGADIRVVTRDAVMGIPFINVAGTGGTYQLVRMIGPTRAIEMLFTAKRISGEDSYALGIATEVVDSDALEEAASAWAERLSNLPTRAVGLMKRAVYRASEQSLEEGLEEAGLNYVLSHFLEDRTEGRAAWLEKRPPSYTNKVSAQSVPEI
jgi:2-(1,2-epoxy-1,2-dihydrophenyl)acetyl-CoA isomerase